MFWSAAELDRTELTWRLSPEGASSAVRTADKAFDFTRFQAVWLRRPGAVQVADQPHAWVKEFAEWESARGLQAIYRMMKSAFWVNCPSAQQEACHKPAQLELARQAGLAVPKTLITNNPESARQFYEETNGCLVYKLIDEGSNRFMPLFEPPRGLQTQKLLPADLPYLDQVSRCLHLFQEQIDKHADVRVTAVGRKLFPVAIHSQEGRGKVDFRLDYSVPMHEHSLPQAVAESCLNVMRALGLNFGAFDFALARDGTYYFLEVNPAGQWLWMEEGLGLPISRELARLLVGKEEPLV